MSIESSNLTNSIFRRMESSEKKAFPENNSSFQERIRLSEKKLTTS